MESIKVALDELHELKLSHNDVRLPNICFNQQFEAVLIDLDRCYCIDYFDRMLNLHPYVGSGQYGCMYEMLATYTTGEEQDFLQLGWLIARILNPGGDEHDRAWVNQPKHIQDNEFVRLLVQKGDYKSELLQQHIEEDSSTIKEVLLSAD